jgi:hypothetical protein
MKTKQFLVAGTACGAACLLGLNTTPAQADVSWEHKGTMRVSILPAPLVNFKLYTNYTAERSRILMKYSSPMMPTIPIPSSAQSQLPPELRISKVTGTGSLALIQRHDTDRLIAWESQTKSYVDEPWSGTYKKMLRDPWSKTDPKLSAQPVPEFTEEQRARLGAEVRAFFSPLTNRVSRTYFRPLDERRTFKGIEGRGYRLTQMINAGGLKKNAAQWMKVSFEWWLAGDLAGDETIRSAQERSMTALRAAGWPSKSMWQNETGYVMLYMLPEAYMQAIKTLAPGPSLSQPSFGGTPLRMDMTITPPQSAGVFSGGGDFRASLELVERHTYPLADTVFEAPTDYKKVDTAPFWKNYERMQEESSFDKILDAMAF